MDTSTHRRRSRRGVSIDAPAGFFAGLVETVSRPEVLARLGLCAAAALLLLVLLKGWEEPPFRPGTVPPRGVVSRVAFERPDKQATDDAKQRAAARVRVVYAQDKAPIVRLRDGLKNRVAEIAASDSLAKVSREAWLEFAPEAAAALDALASSPPPVAPDPPDAGVEAQSEPAAARQPAASAADEAAATERARLIAAAEEAFQRFRGRVDSKERLQEFEKGIDTACGDLENKGVLDKIQHGIDDGSQTEIDVHPVGNPTEMTRVQVAHVLLGEAKSRLKSRLTDELGTGPFADRVFAWMEPRLSGSLQIDREGTARAKQEAISKTPQQFVRYAAGDVLARADTTIDADALELLHREQHAFGRQQTTRQRLARVL